MNKIWSAIKTIILSLIVVFSLLVIVSALNIGGRRMFVVRSGSMEPKIHTGSVVVDQRRLDYKVGDVITFKPGNTTETVTHRIVEIKTDVNRHTFYTVKGDANDAPDSEPVSKESVVGKVLYSIPLLGYLVAFVKTLPGLLLFIIIPATIVIYDEISNIKSEVARIRATKNKVVEEVEKMEKAVEKETEVVEEAIGKEIKQAERALEYEAAQLKRKKNRKRLIKDVKESREP